jgi:cytochrome b
MEELHEAAANGMMAVVAIHIAGVIVSSWLHNENLVKAMITGWKKIRNENPAG